MIKKLFIQMTVVLFAAHTLLAAEPQLFLFLKTGEKFATQETAGPVVAGLTDYLGSQLGFMIAPRVFNEPSKAVEFCPMSKPAWGIVTPGFYLAYAKALKMEPLLETRRAGVETERCALVAAADASDDLAAWQGRSIATLLAAEQRYVVSVILQGKLGEEIRLKVTQDVEGSMYDLAEKAKTAADAVLVEEATWKLFQADPDLGAKLKVIFRSDELLRDLVVTFGTADASKLRDVLKQMSTREEGKAILRSIRVDSFVDLDPRRLTKARELFHAP